jgi:peptide/nickel transport system permease protein
LLPVVSVLAVQLGQKLGGSVITESIFAINGLGRLALESILGGDIPTVQMLVFVFALTFVVMTLVADLLNAWLDPRLRLG